MTLAHLIERLSAATGPDREIDCLIEGKHPCASATTPHYTASVDAALTLVPPEWAVYEMGEITRTHDGGWYVNLLPRDGAANDASSGHKHPAIALCIAALRARAALRSEKE